MSLEWRDDYAGAVEAAEQAYQAALESGDIAGALYASRGKALTQFNREQLADGLKTCLRAAAWVDYCTDPAAVIALHSIHGGLLVQLGDIEAGFEILAKAMSLAATCDDFMAQWRVRTAYAGALFDIMDFDAAADAAEDSLAPLQHPETAAHIRLIGYSIAGRMFARAAGERALAGKVPDEARLDRASELLGHVLSVARAEKLAYETSEANCFLGLIDWVRHDNAAAQARYTLAMAAARSAGDILLEIETSYWLAWLKSGEGDYSSARAILDRIEPEVGKLESIRARLRHYSVRSAIEERDGAWQDAFRYHKLYHEQFVLDRARLASARAQSLQISLELQHMRIKEDERRQERDRLLQENLRLAAERRSSDLAARFDPLTGLGNRRELDLRLKDIARSGSTCCSLLLVDLDHFKRINDVFSHAVGDSVLEAVGRIFGRAGAGASDRVAIRLGGEEFLLLMNGQPATAAAAVAEELRLAVETYPWRSLNERLEVTCSIGVAEWRPQAQPFDDAVHLADLRLYAAKQAGRNRSISFLDA